MKHRPRKRFGQHFLTDPSVIDAIVHSIAPSESDTIVEIGPGPGAITGPLASRCGQLHAVELDRDLAAALRLQFGESDNFQLHEADALSFDFSALGPELRLVGNLPYNISTPLLFHLMGHRDAIVDMHFMLQKEVVDRIAAEPGSKAYGRLTIMLGCHFESEALFDVPPEAFDPPPAVTSAIVRLRPRPAGEFAIDDEALLSRLVATAFSQRRKTLRNALKSMVEPIDLDVVGIDPTLRPEDIEISLWVDLANHLAGGESAADIGA